MKKILYTASIIISVNIMIAGYLFLWPTSPLKKDPVYIALVGTMSGEGSKNGEDMVAGARLCLDKINSKGGVSGRQVRLLIFDDKDRRTAIKIASQIANENKALLVLGHYYSDNSIAAGSVYKKRGIPAVTASATDDSITLDNDWYFRIVPGNSFIKEFIANYVSKALKRRSASIIYDKSAAAGTSLARGFEAEAIKLGISIKKIWKIDRESRNAEHKLKNIIGELRSADSTGIIFCATFAYEGMELFANSRYPGTDYPVFGPDTFSTYSFISGFDNYPRERMSPGYYSDGIMAAAPFIADIGDNDALVFKREFLKKYGREPSWVAACYYDAMKVALEAVERAEIQGQEIVNDRRKIRKALSRFSNADIAIKGVTGDIYFDKDGNVIRPLTVGVWQKHMFLPAFFQYQGLPSDPVILPPDQKTPNQEKESWQSADKGTADDETIKIGGLVMTKTQVVYVGIEINEIKMNPETYTTDFYLWFRFKENFDDANIRFANTVTPFELGKPVLEKTTGDMTTRTYRAKVRFQGNFDYNAYPFDHQNLHITFRHKSLPRTKLIYIHDVIGMGMTADKINSKKSETDAGPEWRIDDISFYQDITTVSDSDKKDVPYSRINVGIRVKRKNPISAVKNYFLIITIVIILYFAWLMQPDHHRHRVVILITAFSAALATHYMYFIRYGMGDIILINAYHTLYALSGISAAISALIYAACKRGATEKAGLFIRLGKIVHIFLVLTASLFITYRYVTYKYPYLTESLKSFMADYLKL